MTQDTTPSRSLKEIRYEILFQGQWRTLQLGCYWLSGRHVYEYAIEGTDSVVPENAFSRFLDEGRIREATPTLTVSQRREPGVPG